ncbi:argininosuccinate synthase [Aquella oligotrophica]|uniref:Argininosuccinate synthase n=1 Tax=Aquella oligotrophica TaxID=2067065 RepID=A0A2I7N477_9NEIS|nr:argininosuccinate synthase [Aquella oligotrophica]AUR51276.1 argininosuccinate synthase [Aquella oligotrophica]
MTQKLLLAYSGGLDTSVILKWLISKGYEVTAFIADVGQDEDFKQAKAKALAIGAKEVIIADCKEEFVSDYIIPALQTGALYENRYLLGTSLARPLIAKKMADYALTHNIKYLAHGATGKGNDQIRFELVFLQFIPDVTIIAPWKEAEFLEKFTGRTDLLNYAKDNNIPVTSTLAKPYSIDENLMHTSYEAGILEDPELTPPDDMYKKTLSPMEAPDEMLTLTIEFNKGIPLKVTDHNNKQTIEHNLLAIFSYLNEVGGKNAIGRIDIVESRFVGMKSRGIYETPGGTILHKAYQDLETMVLDREVILLRAINAPKIGQLIYNGFWFSPEMQMLMQANQVSQKSINGSVKLGLYKGNVIILGRNSPNSLYDHDIASMDKLGNYDQTDAKGFIKLNALRLKPQKFIN